MSSKNSQKNTQISLINFYYKNKPLFNITGFIGLVTTLFLQLTQWNLDSLKMAQVTLLIIFTFLICSILFKFWVYLVLNYTETKKGTVLVNMIGSVFIFNLIFYLFKFLYEAFPEEVLFYFNYTRIGLIFLIIFYIEDISNYLSNNFGFNRLWIILTELVWFLLILSIWIIPENRLIKMDEGYLIIANLIALFFISIFHKLNLVSRRIFYLLIFIVLLITISIYYILF